MLKNKWFVVVLVLFSFGVKGQNITDSTALKDYIIEHADEFGVSKEILTDSNYRLQIVYSQMDTSGQYAAVNTVQFGTDQYYYPASLVKFPVALLTLEKMWELDLGLDDILVINSDVDCGNQKFVELSQRKSITFRQLFKELLIVSDNNFYSSLYHFLTPKEINEKLLDKGWGGTHIYKSFAGCDPVDQLKCNSLSVINGAGDVLYTQNASELDSLVMIDRYPRTNDRWFGSKHENKNRKIVPGPFDLNNSLEIPLNEIHEMLVALVFGNTPYYNGAWEISNRDRDFIIETMKKFPRELKSCYRKMGVIPHDDHYKYALIGTDHHDVHPTLTTSKIGLSYGFTSEIVHIKNEEDGVEFFLSVSLYTNANDIVNDGDYEYYSVAKPFIANLSRLLYAYELEKVSK
jgi:hypothetical protein